MDEHMFQVGERVRSIAALGKIGKVIDIDHDSEKVKVEWRTGQMTWVPFEKLVPVS